MKNVRHLLIGLTMVLAVLSAGVASASSTWGKAIFVGTFVEDNSDGVFHARLRVRINGTCDTDTVAQDRWIIIRSGRTDGIFAHNSVNMKNAYSTLMIALLSDKNVQIDGLPHCSTTEAIFMDLWNSNVGLF
jgi:hypothetical protein